jgi:hypothetical protein
MNSESEYRSGRFLRADSPVARPAAKRFQSALCQLGGLALALGVLALVGCRLLRLDRRGPRHRPSSGPQARAP